MISSIKTCKRVYLKVPQLRALVDRRFGKTMARVCCSKRRSGAGVGVRSTCKGSHLRGEFAPLNTVSITRAIGGGPLRRLSRPIHHNCSSHNRWSDTPEARRGRKSKRATGSAIWGAKC